MGTVQGIDRLVAALLAAQNESSEPDVGVPRIPFVGPDGIRIPLNDVGVGSMRRPVVGPVPSIDGTRGGDSHYDYDDGMGGGGVGNDAIFSSLISGSRLRFFAAETEKGSGLPADESGETSIDTVRPPVLNPLISDPRNIGRGSIVDRVPEYGGYYDDGMGGGGVGNSAIFAPIMGASTYLAPQMMPSAIFMTKVF